MEGRQEARVLLVGVLGDSRSERYRRLLEGLSELFPVKFRHVEAQGQDALDGLIVLEGDASAGLAAARQGVPSYVVVGGGEAACASTGTEVRFANSTSLQGCLRNQRVVERDGEAFCPLSVQPGDEVLASKGRNPVWLKRNLEAGACHLVALSPPLLGEEGFLFKHFNGRRYMGLLPLMSFLRWLVKDLEWEPKPSQACFVFDDPSLHWPTYGYINFRHLAEHSAKHNYFASVATIPLDSFWVDASVASLFRSCWPRLSLLIHGNNHLSRELGGGESVSTLLSMAAQALRRMSRLERKHNLAFCRIMDAPHAAVLEDLLPHLLALGYEGTFGTPELLVQYNPRTDWPATLGMERAGICRGGFPVIPRIRMSADWKNEALLAAFLGQPIVIVGHHQDAAGGLDVLAEIAQAINGFGGVTWSDPQSLLRANYFQRLEGDVLRVRMHARRITVPLAAGVRKICVERPWIRDGFRERLLIAASGATRLVEQAGPITAPIEVGGVNTVEVASEAANPVHFSTVAAPPMDLRPIARKLVMEFRDRLSPMLPALNRLRWRKNDDWA